jgi:malonate-semialdehyde dehydrogenase (acetylating)/methylmalonate-semialdehyde dehydrogenase
MIIMPDADMDQAVDALIGAGYGSAGERCMAVSVAVPVGKATGDRLMDKLIPRVESLKIGPSTDPSAGLRPDGDEAAPRARARLRRDWHQGGRQARRRRP